MRLFSTMDEIIETVTIGEYRYLSDLTDKLNLFERSFVLKQIIVLHKDFHQVNSEIKR